MSESSDDPSLGAAPEELTVGTFRPVVRYWPIGPIGPIGPIEPPVAPPLDPPPPPPPSVSEIVSKYQNYDMNADGVTEIESLSFLAGDENNTAASKGVALVLYDPRLVTDDPAIGISGVQVRLQLALMRSDMLKEGYNARFIQAKVYRGAQHQDGRTLLALRRMLKEIYASHPLKSVTLIGDFPETALVRQVLVRSHQGPEPKMFGTVSLSNVDFVATSSDLLTARSDLILADLDGNWENLYVQPPMMFKDVQLVPDLPEGVDYPAPGQTLTGARYNINSQTFEDFFLVKDRNTTLTEANGQAALYVPNLDEDGPELSAADRSLVNPIARPEIDVSRINARHVALTPYLSSGASTDGQGLLAADGKPRVVRLTTSWANVAWREDPTLERRILTDHLYRNHAFRLGGDNNKPYRTSAVRQKASGLMGPGWFNSLLRKADPALGTSLEVDNADVAEFINWLKAPAVLRGIAAHSDETSAQFPKSNTWLVDTMVGGRPWFWKLMTDAQGYYLQPTIGERDAADFYLYRTLWENKIYDSMGTGQSFYIHDGCTVNGAPQDRAYNTNLYAERQHAESMLFYANGLGMLARGKVFNDTPQGMEAINNSGKRFSASLRGYFNVDAADANLRPDAAPDWANRRTRTFQRKRTYYWGLLGDATIQIRYP